MKYFAYGSNMALARLRGRVPSASFIGVFSLKNHDLKFHKAGKDGSAKCDAFHTGSDADVVEGVVFELDFEEIKHLDRAEGLGDGYIKKDIEVCNGSGNRLTAFTFIATEIDDSLHPFSWYKNHVLVGAISCGLSQGYTEKIARIKDQEDPDKHRQKMEFAIHEQ